jgi:exoribonuclease-2
MRPDQRNRAKDLIEDFMVAAERSDRTLSGEEGFPPSRRVLSSPKRWDRIVQLAADLGERLPASPDAKALDELLDRRRRTDPEGFPDLSLSVVKLLGSGQYAVEQPSMVVTGISGWPCATTRIRRRRTGASRI